MRTIQQFIDACRAAGVPLDTVTSEGVIEYRAPIGFMIREVDEFEGETYNRVIDAIIGFEDEPDDEGEDPTYTWSLSLSTAPMQFVELDPDEEINLELFRLERIV